MRSRAVALVVLVRPAVAGMEELEYLVVDVSLGEREVADINLCVRLDITFRHSQRAVSFAVRQRDNVPAAVLLCQRNCS